MSLARPSHGEYGGEPGALTAYKNRHLFLTGGLMMKPYVCTDIDVYSIDRDQWSSCPKLNIARQNHSTCILGDKLYVSCGQGRGADSIEVANCIDLIDGNSAAWQLLTVRYRAWNHVFCPISDHEILLMNDDQVVSILDTRSNTTRKNVSRNPMKTFCHNNQAVMSRTGQVVALVRCDTNNHLKVDSFIKAVSFTTDQMMVCELKDFGSLR